MSKTPQGPDLSAAIDAIYAAAAVPAQWPEALDAIAAVFGDVGSLVIFQRSDGSFGTIVSPGLEAAQRDYVEAGWSRADIRMARAIERGYLINRDVVTERHLLSDEEIATLPYYTDFLAPHGLKWFAGMFISADPKLELALSMQRRADRPPYSDAELALFGQLGRHVENAFRLGMRLMNAELMGSALADALAQLSVGVYVVDECARILFTNAAAKTLLGDALTVAEGRLVARFRSDEKSFAGAINAVLDTRAGRSFGQPQPIVVRGKDSGRFIAVYVLPIRQRIDSFFAEAKAVVLAIESTIQEPDPAMVRDLLGLTLGEARVAALVGSGLPPRDAAGRLGISEHTVRTTLKRVFDKVGVSRQPELAVLMTRVILG
jgi:DNA-binding CsgD family transcriptional regulator